MNWNDLESSSIEGERPVQVSSLCDSSILSRAGHEESCQKQPGPPGKAKYSQETDSEPVPSGKGEKNPEQGSEIEPETIRLQPVGAVSCCDGVPIE